MGKVYEFVGGRKMFVFYFLVFVSIGMFVVNSDIAAEQVFQFWEWITSILVLGNVAAKFSKADKPNE